MIPVITETLVLRLQEEEIRQRIEKSIADRVLNGHLKEDGFIVNLALRRPPQFSPVVQGRIESSVSGSLVLLRYELLRSWKWALAFWSIVVLLAGGAFAVAKENIIFLASAIIVLLVVLWIVRANMKIHQEAVRATLLDILS